MNRAALLISFERSSVSRYSIRCEQAAGLDAGRRCKPLILCARRLTAWSELHSGLHLVAYRASIHRLLMRNDAEARALGFRGTPGVLVGRRTVSGISDLAALKSAVALSRSTGADQ